MDEIRLNELEQKEMGRLDKLYDQVVDKISLGKNLEPLDFYPEIISFVKGKTYTNWLAMQRSILLQLPFYDAVIMPIFPLRNEEIFKRETGINVQETMDLYKKKKVLPLLQYPPLDFKDLDYLDPILELDLPVLNIRQPAYDQVFSAHILGYDAEQIFNWYEEGKEILKTISDGKIDEFQEFLTSLISKNAIYESDFVTNFGYAYARLMLLGYSDLIQAILHLPNSISIAKSLWLYEKVLSAPHHSSLGGVVSWDSLDAMAARNLGIDPVNEFPIDIGKLLIKEFDLVSIKDFGFEKIIDITNATGKSRKALFDLDKAVELQQKEKIIDRSQALRKTWDEANEVIRSMQRNMDNISKYMPLSIGVIGGITTLFDTYPGIISTIFGIAGTKIIASPVTEIILKLRKPSHVISIFDLKKEVNKNPT